VQGGGDTAEARPSAGCYAALLIHSCVTPWRWDHRVAGRVLLEEDGWSRILPSRYMLLAAANTQTPTTTLLVTTIWLTRAERCSSSCCWRRRRLSWSGSSSLFSKEGFSGNADVFRHVAAGGGVLGPGRRRGQRRSGPPCRSPGGLMRSRFRQRFSCCCCSWCRSSTRCRPPPGAARRPGPTGPARGSQRW